jgi:hypothetical protein
MFIETQISKDKLLEQLREGLREAVQTVVVQEWSGAGQTLLFDHIDVLDTTTITLTDPQLVHKKYDDWPYHNLGVDPLSSFPNVFVDAGSISIRQSLDIYPAAVFGAGTDNPQLVFLPKVNFSFSLGIDARIDDVGSSSTSWRTKPVLEFSAYLFALDPIPDVAAGLVQAAGVALESAIGVQTLDLPIPTGLGNLNYANAGVTLNNNGSTVAIMLQAGLMNEYFTQSRWDEFHSGRTTNLTDPGLEQSSGPAWDWGVALNSDFLRVEVESAARDGLSGLDPSKIWLQNRGVNATVGTAAGHLQIGLYIPLTAATDVLGITIDIDVNATVDLEVTAPGRIRATANVTVHPDVSLPLALLAVVTATAAAAVVSILVAVVPGAIVELVRLVIAAVDLLASLHNIKVLPATASPQCQEGPLDLDVGGLSVHKTIVCETPATLAIPLSRKDQVLLRTLFTFGDRVIATGDLTPLPHLPRPMWSLVATAGDWIGPNVGCGDIGPGWGQMVVDFGKNPKSATYHMSIGLTTPLPPAVSVVNAWIATDDRGLISASVSSAQEVAVTVGYDRLLFTDAKPIRVIVHTTEGVRMLTMPPIPDVPIDRLRGELIQLPGECKTLTDDFTRRFGRYNVKWSVDPPETMRAHRRLWDILVGGVTAGEELELLADGGERVAGAVASSEGFARLTFLDNETNRPADMAVARTSERKLQTRDGASAPTVTATQTILEVRSDVEFDDRATSVSVGSVDGREILAVLTPKSVDVVDVSRPDRPVTIASFENSGYERVSIMGSAILVEGESGVSELPLPSGLQSRTGRSISRDSRADIATSDGPSGRGRSRSRRADDKAVDASRTGMAPIQHVGSAGTAIALDPDGRAASILSIREQVRR